MEEFNIQGNQTSFYKYCPETFGSLLYFRTLKTDAYFATDANKYITYTNINNLLIKSGNRV